MELIGGIQHIENRLDGRKPKQGKGKPAQKKTGNNVVNEKKPPADANHSSAKWDTLVGRTVDTTA